MRKCSILKHTARNHLWVVLLAVLLPFEEMAAQCNPDVTPPAITCPPNVTVHTVFGDCSVVVSLPTATVSDNCTGSVTQSNNAPAGNDFPIGINQVTFTATDAAGNAAECITEVRVNYFTGLACNDQTVIQQDPSGVTVVTAADMEVGTNYCFPRLISLGTSGPPSPSITINGTGSFLCSVWMNVPAQGYVTCWGTVNVAGATAVNDWAVGTSKVIVSPNPAGNMATFRLPESVNEAHFRLINQLGQTVISETFTGQVYIAATGNLASGIYYYSIETKENQLFTGKIALN